MQLLPGPRGVVVPATTGDAHEDSDRRICGHLFALRVVIEWIKVFWFFFSKKNNAFF
jgi:hypothetical protein